LVVGDVTNYDVSGSDGLWRVAVSDVSTVDGKVTKASELKSQTAVFDTTV